METLNNKIALVTGASRGIGKAIALQLADAGATVIGTATSDQGAENISGYLKQASNAGVGVVLNVTQQAQVDEVITMVTKDFAAPAVLVNNAAVTRDNILMRMKAAEWQEVIDTDLTSVFRLSKACVRGMMKQRWGRIINISSVTGFSGNIGQTNYTAAKAGMVGFTKSLAIELASRNITVNCIAPGFIETDMTKDIAEEHAKFILSQVPAARMGHPDEIAEAVRFLATGGAYITGETLHVNGGMYMS